MLVLEYKVKAKPNQYQATLGSYQDSSVCPKQMLAVLDGCSQRNQNQLRQTL
ncbi:hypothetical protein MiSe_94190 [Microseira wollei NIES-4236]|uniref:Transposase n=1 Tax=Microseira wollei NIES-4236 TaxID=2530354 RepID=A0AAV3WQS6_9CYAN|nr:hypothetical protein MiSe_94190 [Microseira wollei NIES-4236]